MDEDREDLPANWRSVVDPNTGRTYWYHRKTRVSTWTKPACLNDVTPAQNLPPAVVKSEVSVNKTVKPVVASKPQQPKQLSLSESIDRSLATNDSTNLQLLLSYIKPINPKAVGGQPGLISSLVNIIIQTKLTAARQAGLRCLWSLTRDRKCVATNFHANQSWVTLVSHYHKWEDVESVLVLSACICNLLIGRSTYSLVTSNIKEALVGYLHRILESTDLSFGGVAGADASTVVKMDLFLTVSSDMAETEAILSPAVVQLHSVLIGHGHILPAVLSLVLIAQSFRVEKWIVSLVKMGGMALLQSICTSQLMDGAIKDKARQCLLLSMARSSFVRERVLDSLLDVTSDMTCIPLAMGPDPALFNNASSALSTTEAVEERQSEIDLGYYEITEEVREGEELPQLMNRDVEWIPLSGTAWALSSSVLWSRCPALREVIDSFWTEGGAGLELSIDASDETLACLVKYVHSGFLLVPSSLDRQLELLRVSSELDMLPLYLAVESGIKLCMTTANVAQVVEFARTNEFPDLENAAKGFIRSGGQSIETIRFEDAKDNIGKSNGAGKGRDTGVALNENSSNTSLRDAIYASLQDVADVFVGGTNVDPTKPPSPLSKNQLLQAAAAAKLVKTLQMDHNLQGVSQSQAYAYEDYHNISMEDILQDRLSGPTGSAASAVTQQQAQQSTQRQSHASQLPRLQRKQHSYREEDLADPNEDAEIEEQYQTQEYEDDYEMMQSTDYFTGDNADVSRMTMDQSIEYDPDSSYKGSSAYSSMSGHHQQRSKSGAPKSGGIYGLLLKEGNKTSGVPGRAPENNRRSQSSGFGSSASTDRAAKPAKAVGTKVDTSATPRTARATSLLAGARPSGAAGSNYLAPYQEEDHYGRMASGSIDGYNSEGEIGDFNGATEYVKQMSLAPSKELSEREKKLIEMSKPRQAVPKKKPSVKPSKDAPTEEESNELAADEPSVESTSVSASTVVSAGGGPPAVSSKKPAAPSGAPPKKPSSQPSSAIPSVATTTAGGSLQGLAVPKRATSPAPQLTQSQEDARLEQVAFNNANSLDDHSSALATPGSAVSPVPVPAGAATNTGFTVDPNVRGSLTLLKNKTAGNRRRRSVADVDVSSANGTTDTQGDEYSSGSSTPTPQATTSNAFSSRSIASTGNNGSVTSGGVASSSAGPKVVSVDLSTMMTEAPSTNKPPARKPVSLSSLMGLQSNNASVTRQEIADARGVNQNNYMSAPTVPQTQRPNSVVTPSSGQNYGFNEYDNEDENEEEDYYQQSHKQTQQQQAYGKSQSTSAARSHQSHSGGGYGGYHEENDDEELEQDDRENDADPYGGGDTGDRLTCPDCGRQFAEGPYQKHVNICAKVFLNKRKAFDSAKKRMEAIPELQELQQQKKGKKGAKKVGENTTALSAASAGGGSSSKWKEQSNQFREAMKAARQFKQAVATGAPLPPVQLSAPDPSLIQCPHCSRRFNEKAAERHIPHCQTAKNKPNTLKKGSGVNAASGTANVAATGGNKAQVKGGVKW